MEKWFVYAKKADFQAWAARLGVDPVIARLIRNRDVVTEEEAVLFLRGALKDCHSPWLLKDMDLAVEGVLQGISAAKKIRVIGDYDVDGICASYILTKGFSLIGASVDVAIPHRIHDGYGLNENLIREAHEDGIGLIVTCDNGISAAAQIGLAGEMGMDVIVTDHHEVPFVTEGEVKKEVLPKALAVVDPKRSEDEYPFPGICGGVVAFKLMQAVKEQLEKELGAEDERVKALKEGLEEFLEFAAFSTVCDIMELKDENRIIVREGLKRMRNSRNLGIRALFKVNEIDPANVSAYHLGFVLGPCMNATGRLDTAKRALELLNCTSDVEATQYARDLKELNDSRKNLTLQGVEKAIETYSEQGMEGDKVLVIYLPGVHESLAGIIAGRVREQYGRPAFVLTDGEEGIKGSGRSVEGYDMYGALMEVKDLLTKFGGHKMAAGLSLEAENVEEFRSALNRNCKLSWEDFIPCLHVDAAMPMDYATLRLAEQIECMEPFGLGNPKPLFAQKDVLFLEGKRMGKNGQYGRFLVQAGTAKRVWLTFFGNVEEFLGWLDEKYGAGSGDRLMNGQGGYSVTIAYQVGKNTFRGNEELQFLLKSYQ